MEFQRIVSPPIADDTLGKSLGPTRAFAALLLALVCTGCTITGLEREATKDLHWFGFKSHTDLSADTRWQFSPDSRVLISESIPAREAQWKYAAEEGVYSVFQPPDTSFDLVLLISWPQSERVTPDEDSGWRLLPKTSDPIDVTLKLISVADKRVVQNASLKVDPSWFSPSQRRPTQIEASFRRYAQTLAAKR